MKGKKNIGSLQQIKKMSLTRGIVYRIYLSMTDKKIRYPIIKMEPNMLAAEYSYEDDIHQEGLSIGFSQGLSRGLEQGELIRILIAEGQYDKLAKVSENREYRSKLLKQYGI